MGSGSGARHFITCKGWKGYCTDKYEGLYLGLPHSHSRLHNSLLAVVSRLGFNLCLTLSLLSPCFLKYCQLCSYPILNVTGLFLLKYSKITYYNVFLNVSRDPEFTNILTLFWGNITYVFFSPRFLTFLYLCIVSSKIA